MPDQPETGPLKPTIIVIEVRGNGRDPKASQETAANVIKQSIRQITGLQANIEECVVLEDKKDKAFERWVRYSKGSP